MTVHGSLHQAHKVEKIEKFRKFEADAFVLFPENKTGKTNLGVIDMFS